VDYALVVEVRGRAGGVAADCFVVLARRDVDDPPQGRRSAPAVVRTASPATCPKQEIEAIADEVPRTLRQGCSSSRGAICAERRQRRERPAAIRLAKQAHWIS